jgi:hypothetical protein
MDSLPYVCNDHHAPLISHTPLCSPGPHPVLRLVSWLRSWRVRVLGSRRSIRWVFFLRCRMLHTLHLVLPAACWRPEYSFLMTFDLSLGGDVWELAVEGFSHGQSPLRIQRTPCPIHTPYTSPHGALAIPSLVRFYPPAPSPRDHSPRPSITCIVYPHPPRIITIAGNCFPSRTARSLWRLIHRVPAYVPSVCLRVTYAPAPSYVGRRTSYTLSQQRGACRA